MFVIHTVVFNNLDNNRVKLEPPNGKFKKGMVENFSFDALDVGRIKVIEVGFTTN